MAVKLRRRRRIRDTARKPPPFFFDDDESRPVEPVGGSLLLAAIGLAVMAWGVWRLLT